MRHCEQMPGLSILAHGEMVHAYYLDLHNHILNQQPLRFEWKLPEWIESPALWEKQINESVMEEYQVLFNKLDPWVESLNAKALTDKKDKH